MAKRKHTYWLEDETHVLIESEAKRLTAEQGQKVYHADVIALAIVKWCSVNDPSEFPPMPVQTSLDSAAVIRARAEAAIREIETKPVETVVAPKVNPRAESVAQRRARETKEHAEALAKSDYLAQVTGRDDIDYDLENVPHRPVGMPVPVSADGSEPKSIIQKEPTYKRSFKPLARPHGGVEAKRKREQ